MKSYVRSAKVLTLVILLLVLAEVVAAIRPVPAVTASLNFRPPATSAAVALPWPSYGQSAVGAIGYGVLANSGLQKQMPTASVAKIITALMVLKQKPLQLNQPGPTITITSQDVDLYNMYAGEDGSVVPVNSGEQISEYQMLEAMLLPSANNMADSLATWAYGSISAYSAAANSFLAAQTISNTRVATDASGFSADTVSTAADLVRIGELAMANPVLAQVVSEKQADVPVAGTINNVNYLLGTNNIIGIKTGNTAEAGGCYLFAAAPTQAGAPVIVGAVMGAPTLYDAMVRGRQLADASQNGFKKVLVVNAGQVVGTYHAPWGTMTPVTVKNKVSLIVWRGSTIKSYNQAKPLAAPMRAGVGVGLINFSDGQQTASSPLVLAKDLSGPPFWWRLLH